MTLTPRRGVATVVAVTATAALIFSGCASASPDAPATLDPENLTELNVIRSSGGQFEPLILGMEQGFFEEEGLKLNVKAGTGNPASLAPQLVSGQIQFAQLDIASPISAVAEGVPISLLSVIQNDDPSLPSSAGVLVPPGSDITSVADLEGKTIATNQLAGLPVISTNIALGKAGVPLDSVTWVQLTPDALADAALGGQADAILTFAAFFAGAVEQGFTFLEDTAASQTLPRITQVVWSASDQYIAENPEIVEAFVRANAKAEKYANENPDLVRAVDKEFTKLPESYIDTRAIQPFSGPFHVDIIQQAVDAMVEQGYVSQPIDVATDLLWSGAKLD
ncbi:MAG: ABC transporter substrate-binding protein [Microbacterium sp.]|uniref:ABC transporter substrate-binding protein n=1 Tax=Microbacterium sp. TaxID=51671 RepID=UPI003A8AA642